jgi:hypothetical protein
MGYEEVTGTDILAFQRGSNRRLIYWPHREEVTGN